MPSPELDRLHRLAELDAKILTARTRRAALDGGKARLTALRGTKARLDAAEGAAGAAEAEATDARLQEAAHRDKAAAVEKELYSGRVTAPREVEDRNRQIESVKAQAERIAARLPELRAAAAPLRAEADRIKTEFEAERREAAVEVKRQQTAAERLAAALAELEPRREGAAKGISPALLAKYDGIRARHKGTGMADVTSALACSACGAAVAEKVRDALAAGRVVACENCHRILYSPGL